MENILEFSNILACYNMGVCVSVCGCAGVRVVYFEENLMSKLLNGYVVKEYLGGKNGAGYSRFAY